PELAGVGLDGQIERRAERVEVGLRVMPTNGLDQLLAQARKVRLLRRRTAGGGSRGRPARAVRLGAGLRGGLGGRGGRGGGCRGDRRRDRAGRGGTLRRAPSWGVGAVGRRSWLGHSRKD